MLVSNVSCGVAGNELVRSAVGRKKRRKYLKKENIFFTRRGKTGKENVTMMVGHAYRHCEDRARILDSEFLMLGV